MPRVFAGDQNAYVSGERVRGSRNMRKLEYALFVRTIRLCGNNRARMKSYSKKIVAKQSCQTVGFLKPSPKGTHSRHVFMKRKKQKKENIRE